MTTETTPISITTIGISVEPAHPGETGGVYARMREEADRQRERADNLEIALRTSREIGIAIGIVMSRFKVDSDGAFETIRQASQSGHRKIRDLVQDIILTGTLDVPEMSPPQRRTEPGGWSMASTR